jgi:hypothetical protein
MKLTVSILLRSLLAVALGANFAFSQLGEVRSSQEISDDDGLPVLIKHLPEWEAMRESIVFATRAEELQAGLGDRPLFELIDWAGGTEAAAAPYASGTLLIVEYTTPPAATDANFRFNEYLNANPESGVAHRRIGNYMAFVLDVRDPAGAEVLLDQVKYEKTVQWLGEDPFLLQKIERYFALTGRDVALATVMWIASGALIAVVLGIFAGIIFFRVREKGRLTRTAYSDAGGLTRLNLDGLAEPMVRDRS